MLRKLKWAYNSQVAFEFAAIPVDKLAVQPINLWHAIALELNSYSCFTNLSRKTLVHDRITSNRIKRLSKTSDTSVSVVLLVLTDCL